MTKAAHQSPQPGWMAAIPRGEYERISKRFADEEAAAKKFLKAKKEADASWRKMQERIAENKAMLAARNTQVLGIAALFGLSMEDARLIERDFRTCPDHRRSEDLTKHCALTLRARARFLSGRGKVVAA